MAKRIPSFDVDHEMLHPGVYVSRSDGDIVTWDLRFTKPNVKKLSRKTMHSIEHIVATVARLEADRFFKFDISKCVVYFGPMGCGTGFYFILRGLDPSLSLRFIKWVILRSSNANLIPGCSRKECGSYRMHNLRGALKGLQKYYKLINELEICDIKYPSN